MTESADGDVDHYLLQIFDGMGQELLSQEFTATTTTLGTRNMREGEVYTLRVTAVPVNGTVADGKSADVRFALERCSRRKPRRKRRPRRRRKRRPRHRRKRPTQAPTEAPTQAPTEAPTQAPTEARQKRRPGADGKHPWARWASRPSALSEHGAGRHNTTSIPISPFRGVRRAMLRATTCVSPMASRYSSTAVTETSLDFPLTNLADNVTYDVTITAIPTNGTVEDGQSTTLYFAKAAPQVGTVSARPSASAVGRTGWRVLRRFRLHHFVERGG